MYSYIWTGGQIENCWQILEFPLRLKERVEMPMANRIKNQQKSKAES
jgi:hypothetical protein